jgi:hypothetical protein
VRFRHSDEIWRDFPALVPGVMFANGVTGDVCVADQAEKFLAVARSRLALHDSAPADMSELTSAIAAELTATWSIAPPVAVLTSDAPCFTFGA